MINNDKNKTTMDSEKKVKVKILSGCMEGEIGEVIVIDDYSNMALVCIDDSFTHVWINRNDIKELE